MDNGSTALLTAPDPELEALSFAHSDPESVGEWIGRLPMANVSETAGQIRQAIFEIARLDTDWATRMSLLEGIRPTVLYLANRLDRAANGAGNHADGIARLAQRLQSNMTSGYNAVILSAADLANEDPEVLQSVSLAIHRGLSDLSRTLLRTLQYYVAPTDNLWLKLNQLYLLAERLGINDDIHEDSDGQSTVALSITGTYLRSLLLGLARPYQLRHRQLSEIFKVLAIWVSRISLDEPGESDLYQVDLSSDRGPAYSGNFDGGEALRGISTDLLAEALEAFLNDGDADIVVPSDIDDALISHLAEAWGELKTRAFGRSESQEPMKVSVGMRSTHFFLSGALNFGELLGRAQEKTTRREINPFLTDEVQFLQNADDREDVWDQAFDVGGKIPVNPNITDPETMLYSVDIPQPTEPKQTYQHYDTTTADMSPAGYRLRWNEPFPVNLQTGELVGLRDESDPRWCLAVVRWIRQDDEGPFMGVELLAPLAKPVAVRLIQSKGGGTEYQRAFVLPELKPIGQPASLITPATPFQTGQKVHFLDEGTVTTAQLGQCLLKTESFNQFTFRLLDGYLETPQNHRNMGNPGQFNDHHQSGFR
jgi:hypothetical protein